MSEVIQIPYLPAKEEPTKNTVENTKGLYKFTFDCMRMGTLRGLFVAPVRKINAALHKEMYFGEVLGKHSEICGPLDSEDLELLTTDAEPKGDEFIREFERLLPDGMGYNPLHYIDEGEEDEEGVE